jgi:hypothetical protein
MMKLSIILPVLALTTTINAVCLSSGTGWGGTPLGRSEAYIAARSACDNQLGGNYPAAVDGTVTRTACRDGTGRKYEFQIWHIHGGLTVLHPNQCFVRLEREITNCELGGETEDGDWRYR